MRNCWYLFLTLGFFACTENEPDPLQETFEVSIVPSLDAIEVREGRVANNEVYITDYFYYLYDVDCNEIDSEGRMTSDGQVPNLVLPNLEGGTYYVSLALAGNQNIRYDTAFAFTLESDTTLEASLANYQTRFRMSEVSDFIEPEVHQVRYFLNFDAYHRYVFTHCTDGPGEWITESYDGYLSQTGYDYNADFSTELYYHYPTDITSVQVKFLDQNEHVLKSYIIELEKQLLLHHSYTFEVNLDAIWTNATAGNAIILNVEDVAWTEETVELN